jgi:hypothetical protein
MENALRVGETRNRRLILELQDETKTGQNKILPMRINEHSGKTVIQNVSHYPTIL